MNIQCSTENEFYNAIAGMVKRGLLFRADSATLTITLTGGY